MATSVIVAPEGENSLWAENTPKAPGYVPSTSPNSAAPDPLPSPDTRNPVPGVENTTPRGEFTLKKFAGREFGDDDASGTPSQLISRRPVPFEPAVFGLSGPSAVRKAATVLWIATAFAPAAENTTGAALAVAGRSSNSASVRARRRTTPIVTLTA